MSVTGSQINLEDGETEKIITDDQGDRTYLVEVVGANAIRVSHTKRYANDGTTLSAGQTHTVSNLRGERLYAAAYDGPSAIRVREAAADVKSQPEREVSVVGDVTVGSNIDIEELSSNTSNVGSFSQTISGSTSLNSLIIPNGFQAVIVASRSNNDTVIIDGSFPLEPGDSLSLGVNDTSQISVNVVSGSQTVNVISEVA